MHYRPLVIAAAATLAIAGCGESASDKAQKQVCNARADIQTQVKTLQSLPVAPSSISAAKTSLQAIQADVKQIADAQGDLNKDRKQSIQSANDQFKAQLQSIVTSFTSNLSLSNAQEQVSAASKQLVDSYQQTLSKIDC